MGMNIFSGIKHNYEIQKNYSPEDPAAKHKTTFGKKLSAVRHGHQQMKLDKMTIQQLSEFVGKQKLTSKNITHCQTGSTKPNLMIELDTNRREMSAKLINTDNIDNLFNKMKAGYVIENDAIRQTPLRNAPRFYMDDLVTLAKKGSIDGGKTAARPAVRDILKMPGEVEVQGSSYSSYQSGSESQVAGQLINSFLHSERSPRITDVSAFNMNREEFHSYMNSKMDNLPEEDRVLAKVMFHKLGELSQDGNIFIKDIKSLLFTQSAIDSKVHDHVQGITKKFDLSQTNSIQKQAMSNAPTSILNTLSEKLIDYAQTVEDPRTTNVV